MKREKNIVLDIGKNNAKISVFDFNSNLKFSSKTKYPLYKIDELFIKDMNFLISWMKRKIYFINKKFAIDKIIVTTHGAAFGCIDKNHKKLFDVIDYENDLSIIDPIFDKIKPRYNDCYSPDSEKGLSIGKQLLYLKLNKKNVFKRIKYILFLPQYINWILTNKIFSELSYIGNHTHLWNFKRNNFSSLVTRLKLKKKFPKFKKAWNTIGYYRIDERLRGQRIKVLNGLHDSDASYFLFTKCGIKKFSLISSGTNFVIMNRFASLKILKKEKEMYSGINLQGNKIPTIRFMGGKEYDYLKTKFNLSKIKYEYDKNFFLKNKFLYPSYGIGGPFQNLEGNESIFKHENKITKNMAVNTYIAFLTCYCLDMVQSKDDIIVSGPLVKNGTILKILTALRPSQNIYVYDKQESTSLGASLLCATNNKIKISLKKNKKYSSINIINSYKYWYKNLYNTRR